MKISKLPPAPKVQPIFGSITSSIQNQFLKQRIRDMLPTSSQNCLKRPSQSRGVDFENQSVLAKLDEQASWIKTLTSAYRRLQQQIDRSRILRLKKNELCQNRIKTYQERPKQLHEENKQINQLRTRCLQKEKELEKHKKQLIANAAATKETQLSIKSLKQQIQGREKEFQMLKKSKQQKLLLNSELKNLIEKTTRQLKEETWRRVDLRRALHLVETEGLNLRGHQDLEQQIVKAEGFNEEMRRIICEMHELDI